MANLKAPVGIYPYYSWYLQQRNIYNFNTTGSSPTYVHMKTDIYAPGNDSMWMLEAVGYNYGAAAPIRCAWGFYVYSNNLYQTTLSNIYSGINAHGIYKSSDNYICIRAQSGTLYYAGFTLNAYACRLDTTHQKVSITAAVQSDNGGSYY